MTSARWTLPAKLTLNDPFSFGHQPELPQQARCPCPVPSSKRHRPAGHRDAFAMSRSTCRGRVQLGHHTTCQTSRKKREVVSCRAEVDLNAMNSISIGISLCKDLLVPCTDSIDRARRRSLSCQAALRRRMTHPYRLGLRTFHVSSSNS